MKEEATNIELQLNKKKVAFAISAQALQTIVISPQQLNK
jgi:hypothetical protein